MDVWIHWCGSPDGVGGVGCSFAALLIDISDTMLGCY